MASNGFAEWPPQDRQVPPVPAPSSVPEKIGLPKSNVTSPGATPGLFSVVPRATAATAAATGSAIGLFLLSRAVFQVSYDWLDLTEAILIPILVAFPIATFIFYQADRLAMAKVALARQARDNERQKMLIDELNHRVKNTLATVMSVCAQTARGATDVELFVDLFKGRLVALAGAHDILCRQGWSKVSLGELSAQVLAPYGDRIETQGADVPLRPSAALSLSMVLHELATNAAKHGSLSGNGMVTIRWTTNGKFELEWIESGGPAVINNPVRSGFGSKLIKQVVERELGGSVQIEYRPVGLLCRLVMPSNSID
ncbi:sensor histidine kinase (plasmid) [Mesorhizobium sp. AaZ16]|uniref:sensor histidine kinase n=1 Tax=Mesorhizobium sp. AaZ16 TaxID=3402289 RepID=UPI00374E6EE9